MLQEKLNLLLEKYAVTATAEISGDTVAIDNTAYPLMPHRFERRFAELRKMMNDGTLTGISTIRCGHVTSADVSLETLIRRELDICRYLSMHEVASVMAFANGKSAANMIAVLDNGVQCTIEVANTLPKGAVPIDKHEVISARGLVCDRVVDTQIPQQSIYLYADENEAYTDVDFELYGLNADDVAKVRAAFALAKDALLREAALSDDKALNHLLDCVRTSISECRKVSV
ncbi:MAG: hypothetical protein HFE63_11240 [Clostridiales bacterium]|nr:hypothetical protein [Clostridiales bacterium]